MHWSTWLSPNFFRHGADMKFKMRYYFLKILHFLSFSILYIFYVLLWIKYGFKRFANNYNLLLVTFYSVHPKCFCGMYTVKRDLGF